MHKFAGVSSRMCVRMVCSIHRHRVLPFNIFDRVWDDDDDDDDVDGLGRATFVSVLFFWWCFLPTLHTHIPIVCSWFSVSQSAVLVVQFSFFLNIVFEPESRQVCSRTLYFCVYGPIMIKTTCMNINMIIKCVAFALLYCSHRFYSEDKTNEKKTRCNFFCSFVVRVKATGSKCIKVRSIWAINVIFLVR